MARSLENHYVLAVHDVRSSAAFYVDVLGFEIAADLDGWIFVRKDTCLIMLGECRDAQPPRELGDHSYFAYLNVDDVDAYHAQIQRSGKVTVNDPADKPWGMREFAVTTADGHRIMIGQDISEQSGK